jgi:hypothetical protein
MLLSKGGHSMTPAIRSIESRWQPLLAGQPISDATPEFFAALGRALSLGLNHSIEVATPFRRSTRATSSSWESSLACRWS